MPSTSVPSTPLSPAAPGPWPRPGFVGASVGVHAFSGAVALALPGAELWALGAVALNHAVLTGAGLWPRSSLLGPNVRRLPAGAPGAGPRLAVTVDDGPDPALTPRVLDILDAHGAQATFFCIAHKVASHPALARDIVRRGHSVQNHSHHHSHRFSLMGSKALRAEIAQAQAVVADVTGTLPTCFRAPAGLRNPLLDPVLHALNLHLVSWTRRGYDTRVADPMRVLAKLQRGLADGDILLLHDGNARRDAQGTPVVCSVLPRLLGAAHAAGLRCVTLPHALPPRHAAPRR